MNTEETTEAYQFTTKGRAFLTFATALEDAALEGPDAPSFDSVIGVFDEIYALIEQQVTEDIVYETVTEVLEIQCEDPQDPDIAELDDAAEFIGHLFFAAYRAYAKQAEGQDA